MDDLFGDKKEETTVLDLSKCSADTKEEFKRILEQVPDYKTRPIKVRQDEIKIREKDFKFKISKKKLAQELRNQELQAAAPLLGSPTAGISKRTNTTKDSSFRYKYQNPVPVEMQSLKLDELYAVPIDWRMLTTLRPKNRIDEEYFSRLVELGKASLRTLERDRAQEMRQPDLRKTKNKAGVMETKLVSCAECLEELCDGKTCYKFTYDQFARPSEQSGEQLANTGKQIASQAATSAGIGGTASRGKTRTNRSARRLKTGANQRAGNNKGKLRRSKSVGDSGSKVKSKSVARSKSLGRKSNR